MSLRDLYQSTDWIRRAIVNLYSLSTRLIFFSLRRKLDWQVKATMLIPADWF